MTDTKVLTEVAEVKYERSDSDKTKMKFAFWWCAVKAVMLFLMFFVFVAGMGSQAPMDVQVMATWLFCSVAMGAAISEFISKMAKGEMENTTGFGVITLVLFSIVGGVLLLVCKKDE